MNDKYAKEIAKELKLIRKELQKANNKKVINIIAGETKELIASIGKNDIIVKDDYEVIETED